MPDGSLRLEHPNEIGRLTPWQVDFRQLDPGRLDTRIAVSVGRSVSALQIAMTQRVHQRGSSPDGWTTFGIPSRGAIESWKGRRLLRDAILSFGDSDGFDGVSSSAFSGNVVSFDTQRLKMLAQSCGFAFPEDALDARDMRSDAGVASLRRLDALLADQFVRPDANWTAMVEESMMLEALSILTECASHADKSHAVARRRALNRAVDIMQDHLEDPILIEDLCRLCGASWRTLDRAFKEQFGQGPKSYYIRLRLNRVREDLLNGTGAAITDIANRYGFWHLGQFARDYKLFFGELPSETRQRLVV